MNTVPESDSKYQVGGSLAPDHPSYVERQADKEFYENLKRGIFCYVLNSRQMGKSSLRVHTMQELQKDNIICIGIDVSTLCERTVTREVTQEEWYGAFLDKLVRVLKIDLLLSDWLDFSLNDWWQKNKFITPLQRLSKFIEEELLQKITNQNIVIFVDEIDRLIDISFKEDFFVFIRECYNKRAVNNNYNCLTFALLGVATPSDLITDINRTPFNIESKAIELTGFKLEETKSLQKILECKVSNPKVILQSVLRWTGGQPFLTQRVCQMILSNSSEVVVNQESSFVENIVRSQIIENWRGQDEKNHLDTILTRLLNSKNSSKLLQLYQQILQKGEIPDDKSQIQLELRLSGLVILQQGKLKIYNSIYENIFNKDWVNSELGENLSMIESSPENEIFKGLSEGDFCYILSSPISEKERILKEVQEYLNTKEILFVIINNSKIYHQRDAQDFKWNTRGDWYLKITEVINREVYQNKGKNKYLDVRAWWRNNKSQYDNHFPGYVMLNDYLEQQILDNNWQQKIVIIFDCIFTSKDDHTGEIKYQHLFDELKFKDEVFNFIYLCYEKRRKMPEYQRLTFLLLDTAIHPKRIEAEKNMITIAWRINFEILHNQKLKPLIIDHNVNKKLTKVNYEEVIESIWDWTNGHLFLTRKLIELFFSEKHKIITGQERSFINDLVQKHIILKFKNYELNK